MSDGPIDEAVKYMKSLEEVARQRALRTSFLAGMTCGVVNAVREECQAESANMEGGASHKGPVSLPAGTAETIYVIVSPDGVHLACANEDEAQRYVSWMYTNLHIVATVVSRPLYRVLGTPKHYWARINKTLKRLAELAEGTPPEVALPDGYEIFVGMADSPEEFARDVVNMYGLEQ